MTELERYFGTNYSNICQKDIITKTPETFPYPKIPTIIPDTGVKHPKTYTEMTYTEKKNINEAICQKLKKKDVYETDMHKIYNIIVGKKNKQLQKNETSDATFQVVKTGWDPIGYLMILKKLWF